MANNYSEGDIVYTNSPNVQVVDSNGELHRAQLVAVAPGDIKFNTPDNSPNVQVMGEDGNYHRAQLVAAVGLGSALENRIIIKSDTIPAADGDSYRKFYCYSGDTNSTYTHGYVYECKGDVTDDSYITFDPASEWLPHKLGFDYTNHNVFEVFERVAEVITPTFNPMDVASGSLRLDKTNELWYITAYDANGDLLFEDFTIGGTGDEYCLDAYGFVYLNPFPDDYEEDYTETFEITKREIVTNFRWERIDLQPGITPLPTTPNTEWVFKATVDGNGNCTIGWSQES